MTKTPYYKLHYGVWKINGYIIEENETQIKSNTNETKQKSKDNSKGN